MSAQAKDEFELPEVIKVGLKISLDRERLGGIMKNKRSAQRKRAKAIAEIRAIDAQLGDDTLKDLGIDDEPEIIDVEIVSVEIVDDHISKNGPIEDGETAEKARSAPLPVLKAPTIKNEPNSAEPQKNSRYGKRRCKAYKKTGEQCKNAARLGTVVCNFHGGKAPQVMAKARQRLQEASNRMVGNLFDLADNAESEAVRLGATNSALDRSGLKAPTTVEIGPTKPYEEIFEGIATNSRAESRSARGLGDHEPNGIGYQHDSADFSDGHSFDGSHGEHHHEPHHTPRPGEGQRSGERPTCSDSDCDRLSGPQSDERTDPDTLHGRDSRKAQRRAQRRPASAPTGETAMRLANVANAVNAARFADQRGLPPGRAGR